MGLKRVHIYVSGRVQGVFFRHNTQLKAWELGLAGWVRNTEDGRVEAVVEGEEDRIERLVDWCRMGPPAARVNGVEVVEEPPTGEFKAFGVRI